MKRLFDPVRRQLLLACGAPAIEAVAGGPLPARAGAAGELAPPAPLRGAGATLPGLLYAAWADAYRQQYSIEVDYQPTNSIAGVEAVERGTVDFGASDVPLSSSELQGRGLVQLPGCTA